MTRRPASFLTLLAASAALLSCGGNESDGVFDPDGYPFTFTYPEALSETDDVTVDQQLGSAADETVGIGLDDDNGILVEHFELRRAVGERNLGSARRELERLLAGVEPPVRLAETSVAGFPALSTGDVVVGAIPGARSDLTFLFDGTDEYLINCQSTEDHRSEIDGACEEVAGSLEPK